MRFYIYGVIRLLAGNCGISELKAAIEATRSSSAPHLTEEKLK